jgi:flagellar basal-body rod modification protein FlgD
MQIDSSMFATTARDTGSLLSPRAAAANSSTDPSSTSTGSAANAASNSGIDTTDALANENTFLQLLVTQIKNQDPTQPMDSTTFLTQLAQFSQLEQLIGIRQDVQSLDTSAATPAVSGTQTS